jgi:hypothetical protein
MNDDLSSAARLVAVLDYLGVGRAQRLAMLGILFERYAKRIPQRGLFEEVADDAEPSRPLTADAGVADGARIHLLHKHDRPYFFGIDGLRMAARGWIPALNAQHTAVGEKRRNPT